MRLFPGVHGSVTDFHPKFHFKLNFQLPGPKKNADEAMNFIRKTFVESVSLQGDEGKMVYTHDTCATGERFVASDQSILA